MDPFQKLCQACSDGTLGIVTEMMSIKGLDVNQTNETEETPLHLACERGFCSLVGVLFTNQGLDVNRGNQFGTTPLSIACQHNRVGVVQLLLARTDLQVNKCDRQERSPLYTACQIGATQVVQVLLNRFETHLSLNQANVDGYTPLNIACMNNQADVVRLLLQMAHIDVNQASTGRSTHTSPLHEASKHSAVDIVRLLLNTKGINSNARDKQGHTPLRDAVVAAYVDHNIDGRTEQALRTVMLFLQQGIGLNQVDEWFNINSVWGSSRLSLYKHARALPEQHQPLLDFHLCRASTQHATAPASALKVFTHKWPRRVGITLETMLLPSVKARTTLQQVVVQWSATLNDTNDYGQTQLYHAVDQLDVEAVRFLLQEEGMEVGVLCGPRTIATNWKAFVYDDEDEQAVDMMETTLGLIDRKMAYHGLLLSSAGPRRDHPWYQDMEKCGEIKTLLDM